MDEKRSKENGCRHVLMIPYPSQGHINPMLQFAKLLSTKGVRATMVTTIFISKTMHLLSSPLLPNFIQFDTISDGYDQGGFAQASSIPTYLSSMKATGSKNLRELIQKYKISDYPIDCLVYDSFLPWVLEVAKEFSLLGAAFFTQMCAVNCIFYYVHHGLLKLPISSTPISIPGLPLLDLKDTPSFVHELGVYPAYYELVMNQFSSLHEADVILVNSFYKLEDQVFQLLLYIPCHTCTLFFTPFKNGAI